MINEILSESILRFLSKNDTKDYTANQILSSVGLKKDDLSDLQSILNDLTTKLIIQKTGKRYQINPQYKVREEKKEKPSVTDNQFIVGTFDATPLAKNLSFAFVITEDDNDVMVAGEDILNAYHQDTVEVEVTRSTVGKRYGIIRKIIERKKSKFVGTVNEYHNKYLFTCDSFKIHTPFEVIEGNSSLLGKKVIIEIDNWGSRVMNQYPTGKIVEVLGESGLPEVELMAVIRDFDLPLEFPEEVIKEAVAIDEKISEADLAGRSDFRNLFTITIDPISAKDFDDAISLEETKEGHLRLYVHIADVAHYIKFNSQIFAEAMNRGNSYYFPKKVIPMLPEILSNKICSLRPMEEKLTVTVITDFNQDGQIVTQDVCESVINSDSRLTYEEVDLLFEGKVHPFNEQMVTLLNLMRRLSKVLSKKRVKLGYLKFDLPEVEYVFDDEGYLTDLKRSRETDSHTLIENFMLTANEYVAKLLTKTAGTTIYRIHEEPEQADLFKIKDILQFHKIHFQMGYDNNKTWQNVIEALPTEEYHRVFDRMILRSMKKAKYSTAHIAHFGLGLSTYTHFTSPIRRLCDLIVHAQLKKHVFHKSVSEIPEHDLSVNSIFNYAGISTKREMVADESERAMEQKIVMSFMKKKLGEIFKGVIISFTNSAIVIELDELPVRGVVKYNSLTDDYYELYDKIKVLRGRRKGRIFKLADKVEVQISMISDDIYFSIKAHEPGYIKDKKEDRKKKGKSFRYQKTEKRKRR
jgi:ribonuclease R